MAKNAQPKPVLLQDYTPPAWQINDVDLNVALYEEQALVTATIQFQRSEASSEPQDLVLDGENLALQSITVNGQALSSEQYQCDEQRLTVFAAPSQGVLTTVVKIEPQNNTALEGLYRSGGMFCTQCEADGFHNITYFLDRPDVLAVYQTRVEADKSKYPVLLSNGNPIDSGDLPEGRHYVTWQDPFPKPCYLFALVAGDLHLEQSSFTTQSGRNVDLRLYVEPQNADKCDHAMLSLKNAMRWDEQTFGLEYDLDIYMIVAVDDFNMGAMENKGLNVFNSRFVLARPEIAEDVDYEDIEAVIGHEYFHNWTGNRVTCRDWFQLSLKEGLTVFREQEFSADMNARSVKRIADVRRLRSYQFPEDAGPTAHPIRPDRYNESNNLYTATVYEKGGEVIRMLHGLVGKQGFANGMALYFERHDGQAVTCEDFVAAIADANQVDLTPYLGWYTQAGTPRLSMSQRYDEAAQQLQLRFSQVTHPTPGQAEKKALPIPIATALVTSDGPIKDVELVAGVGKATADGWVLELTDESAEFVFASVPADAVPSVLRGFSAPVELATDLSQAQKLRLLASETDAFARWDAAQQIALDEITAFTQTPERELSAEFVAACEQVIEAVLTEQDTDLAFFAELFSFPDEAFLLNRLDKVDVPVIHAAVQAFKQQVAERLAAQWQSLYQYCYARCDTANGRALANIALAYVARADRAVANDWTQQQASAATCMTEQMGALRVAVHQQLPAAEPLLAAFYQQWQHEPLVVNKWLSVQASQPTEGALAQVVELADSAAFDITNPNKVRALFNVFATANPVGFHGGGADSYRFVADQVARLNEINPQVAARLVGAFNHWKKFDGDARSQMQRELQRLQAMSGISSAVADIVGKALS